MTQRAIEVVIGRLLTDEGFRDEFRRDPHETLAQLLELGVQLTQSEILALVATNPGFWTSAAEHIDPRLQKASLKS